MNLIYHRLLRISIFGFLLQGCRRDEMHNVDTSKSEPKLQVIVPAQATPTIPPSSGANVHQTAARSPKRHEPLLDIPPTPKYAVGSRLKRELLGIDPSNIAFATKITLLWSESQTQLADQKLPSANESSIAKGLILPKEFLINRNVDIATDNPEAMLNALSYLALDRSGLLPDLAKRRANVLPPSGADLASFDAINSALNELSGSFQQAANVASPFEPWEQLASAENPIYRLLALRAALCTTSRAAANLSTDDPSYTLTDAPAKLVFYRRYMSESDPAILSEAVTAMATVPLPEARQAIESFLKERERRGDAPLVQVALDALRTHSAIIQAVHR